MEKEVTKKRGKRKIGLSLIVVMVIAAAMLLKGAMMQPKILENQDKIAELEARKEYEQKRGEEIDSMKNNIDSDEYIEKVAREKLGMIRKDEIVFIDINGQE